MNLEVKERLVRLAMTEADKAIIEGNSPFGAVLADNEWTVIAVAHNTSTSTSDPTAHAEINLIREVCQRLNTKDLSSYYLISNAESCPMCFSAAIKAKISHFVFGAPTELDSNPLLTVFEIAQHAKNHLEIDSGILKEKCIAHIANARK